MVVLDLFGIHASGKTTTIRELEKHCDVELPVADNERRSYLIRNRIKFRKAIKVVLEDPSFSVKMLRMVWKKKVGTLLH
jgi:dephospho-CoA kinase